MNFPISVAAFAWFAVCASGLAQAAEPFELTIAAGSWHADLPDYSFGRFDVSGDPAYFDDLSAAGAMVQTKAIKRFRGTRTSIEGKVFGAWADSFYRGDDANIVIPLPTGNANGVGGEPVLRSELSHFGTDVLALDTWTTDYGDVSFGGGFSYMQFDQEFDLDYQTGVVIDILRQDLDTDFIGGKLVADWAGGLLGLRTNARLGLGLYEMQSDYVATYQAFPNSGLAETSEFAATLEYSGSTWGSIMGIPVGITAGVTWISDFPAINQVAGEQPFLTTASAVTTNVMVEMLLY